jgi:hypothetical protein
VNNIVMHAASDRLASRDHVMLALEQLSEG